MSLPHSRLIFKEVAWFKNGRKKSLKQVENMVRKGHSRLIFKEVAWCKIVSGSDELNLCQMARLNFLPKASSMVRKRDAGS